MKKLISSFIILLAGLFNLSAQEFPISITPQGYIFVQVTLNDSIPANFMLDTGAGINILSQKVFNKIADSAQETGIMTGFRHDGDRLDGPVYQLPALAIGSSKQTDVKVGIYPPLDDYGIDGLVSLKFFENTPFTIDFKNQKLTILNSVEAEQLAKNHDWLPLAFKIERDIMLDIFIPIVLNNSLELQAEFDTGSGFGPLVVNPYYIQKLNLNKSGMTATRYTTPISEKATTDYNHPVNLSLKGTEGIRIENKTATFRENLIYEALIGSEIFKDRAITIDLAKARLIIH